MSAIAEPAERSLVADFNIGPGSITAYSRLSYTLWYALAEFIDNTTQSRENYASIIDPVLKAEGNPLTVDIIYNPGERSITITDNSIGMNYDRLVNGLKIAQPTEDSRGRSRYGMGMKTAACWIGKNWHVRTCEWQSGEEWRATVSVDDIAAGQKIPLVQKEVDKDKHYTEIKIWNIGRSIQKRTEETIMSYLGSMYRMDIRAQRLLILFNGKQVPLPEELEFTKREDGKDAMEDFETEIRGKKVTGWFGVLRTGGRKFGGFSLFNNQRQIKGYPDAWKPRSVFGGVDEEGGNSLVSQRLVGEIHLDDFAVSHTKDAISWEWDEEEKLEKFLVEKTVAMKRLATSMRTKTPGGKSAWDRERLKEILEEAKQEFTSNEFRDTVTEAALPPLEIIQQANQRQVESLSDADMILEMPDVGSGIKVIVAFQDRSENDPHLIFVPSGDTITVIINERHPYYIDLEDSADRVREIVLQYVYDAVAEFRVSQRLSRQEPDAVRKLKDQLLRAKMRRLENKDAEHTEIELEKLGG
jgi:hypothetical protein